jgi:hypothetical protein
MLGLLVLSFPGIAPAQGLGPDELTRQVNPGVVPPYEGAGQVERYSYNRYMVPLYFHWDAQRFYDLEYQDRLERQAKFGWRWPSAKQGSDFQVQRIQSDYERRAESLESMRNRRGWYVGGGAVFGRVR